jgi:hypothetical protein
VLDAGLRLGWLLPLGSDWSLYSNIELGLCSLSTDAADRLADSEAQYSGFQFGLAGGVRYLITPRYGVFFELAGNLSQLGMVSGPDLESFRFQDLMLFRLAASLGAVMVY